MTIPTRAVSGARFMAAACLLLALAPCAADAQSPPAFRILVFSKTAGFRHDPQIVAGTAMIQSLGAANGFAVDATENAALFTSANLAQYAAVVFFYTTGDVLGPAEEAAFQSYVMAGGGYCGVHSATDTEYGWPFYVSLVGASFLNHPAIQTATVNVVDPNHPSTVHLPASFSHNDEWYNFATNPASNPAVHVLLTLDESTYSGGSMGAVHPIAWYQAPPNQGRSWYTGLAHTVPTLSLPWFQQHLLEGIRFVASTPRTLSVCSASPQGSGTGTPVLGLSWNGVAGAGGQVALTGADPGGTGMLGVSAAAAQIAAGPYLVLIDLDPARGFLLPVVFDANGSFALAVPPTLLLPPSVLGALHLQGIELSPRIGLSPALRLQLCI